MLDHQTARRVRKGAHAACALIAALGALAAPASAQLGQLVPATPPAAPTADSSALGGDGAHRNAWSGAGLRPPLAVAWRTEATPVQAPVAVGPRVIVQTQSALKALRTDDGGQIWSVPLTGGPVELATEGGRVYVAADAGVAALEIDTGALLWAAADAGATGPVVDGGRLFTGNAAGELVIRRASSGAVIARPEVGIARARPAVAGARAYAVGTCRAVSVDLVLNDLAWERGCETDAGVRTILTGSLVVGEDAGYYRNSDGALLFGSNGFGTVGAGLVFPDPIGASPAELTASDALSFAPRWTWKPIVPARMLLRPAVVDDVVWQVAEGGSQGLVLAGLDAATGAERWTGHLPGDGSYAPAVTSAVAVSPGLLLVPGADGLVALRNAPEGPLGVRATVPRNVVEVGERTTITGRLTSNGHGLTGPRAVFLQADPHPFEGRYRTVGGTVSGRGGFTLETRVERNTRFRLAADGVRYAPTAVYARPTIEVAYTETKVERVVTAVMRIGAEPGFRRAGRVGLYRLKAGDDVATRIGVGRSKGNGVARFRVRIPADLTETDAVLPCLRRSSERGFGAPNVLDRFCGDKRIAVPAQASSTGLSLSTGTGSAIPLKRFMPASEKR